MYFYTKQNFILSYVRAVTDHYLTSACITLIHRGSANAGTCMLNAHSVTILQMIKCLITYIFSK